MNSKLASKIRELLEDVMHSHADPDSPDYNGCDKDGNECAWCEDAKKLLQAIQP